MSYEAPPILRPLSPESLASLGFISGIQDAFPRQEIVPTVEQAATGAVFVRSAEVAAITDRVKSKETWFGRLMQYPFPPSFFEAQTLATAGAGYFSYAKDGYCELGISLGDTNGTLGREYETLRYVLNSPYMMGKKLKRTEPLLYVPVARVAVLSALDEVLGWVGEQKPTELTLAPFPALSALSLTRSVPDLSDIRVRRIDTTHRPVGAARMPGPPRPKVVPAGE